MNELNPLHQDNTRDERKQHLQRKDGAKHIPTGLKVWQIDPKTGIPEIVKVSMATQADKSLGEGKSIKQLHLKVERNPNFFYCMAINQKNALRKYHKSPFYAAYRRYKENEANSQRSAGEA